MINKMAEMVKYVSMLLVPTHLLVYLNISPAMYSYHHSRHKIVFLLFTSDFACMNFTWIKSTLSVNPCFKLFLFNPNPLSRFCMKE